MKKITFTELLLCLSVLLACPFGAAGVGADDIDCIRRQFIEFYSVREKALPQAGDYLKSLKADGSWAAIDYRNKQPGRWPTLSHLTRARIMALAYATPGNPFYRQREMLDATVLALNFWVDHDFTNPNWWQISIGIPQSLGAALVLLGNAAPESLRRKSDAILARSKMGMTGQNRVWLAGINIIKGILQRNGKMIDDGRKVVFSEMIIAPRNLEGLQTDYSYHQHGPQQQFGNYGLSFVESQLQWAWVLRDTAFAIPPEKMEILWRYFTNGIGWTIWNGQMDISSCGRHLYLNSPQSKATTALHFAESMTTINPAGKTELRQLAEGKKGPVGNRYFWCSDYLIHRRPDYFFSVKMSSSRVIGTESHNNENLQGKYLGDGVSLLMRSGLEYHNIFPVWDWRRLPGITAVQDQAKLKPWGRFFENPAEFVGGVSDGSNGLAVMNLQRKQLTASKVWFCFDRYIVCLGTDISATVKAPIDTAIEQRLLNGPVEVTSPQGKTTLSQGKHRIIGPATIRHDGVVYSIPGRQELTVSNAPAGGNWNLINQADAAAPVTLPVFSLAVNHGVKPQQGKYAWIVSPDGSDPTTNGMVIPPIANGVICAQDRINGLTMGVFFKAGTMPLSDRERLESADPCAVMVRRLPQGTLFLSVADPSQKQNKLHLRLSGAYRGQGAIYDRASGTTALTLSLPADADAGRTATVELTPIK